MPIDVEKNNALCVVTIIYEHVYAVKKKPTLSLSLQHNSNTLTNI